MKLVTFERNGLVCPGAVVGGLIVDLPRMQSHLIRDGFRTTGGDLFHRSLPSSLREILAMDDGLAVVARAVSETVAIVASDPDVPCAEEVAYRLNEVKLWPPIPNPAKIICFGRNYNAHAEEAGSDVPSAPEVFAKYSNTLIGHSWPIKLPRVSQQVDYEAELAVVIGRRTWQVDEEDALDHVAGYTILHDVSARDYQMRTSQWLAGKSMDTFRPVGPWIVTTDEIPDPQALRMRLEIGREVLQDAHTSTMVFSVRATTAYLLMDDP